MWWIKILNALYDLFAAVVSVVDVVSDILIAIQFYREEEWTFFYIALTIFILATTAYTWLFVILFGGNLNRKQGTLAFLCILPFGQVVPLLIWLQAFRIDCVDRALQRIGFSLPVEQEENQESDPLIRQIGKKLRAHGGFIVEALVESVPQSILQMVFIVLTGEVRPLQVFSITVSMISVASKGFIISYNLHRPTFVFSFLCVVADVFNIFCTVSWLGFSVPGESVYNVVFFGDGAEFDVLTTIWMYKEVCLVIGVVGLLLLGAVSQLFLSLSKIIPSCSLRCWGRCLKKTVCCPCNCIRDCDCDCEQRQCNDVCDDLGGLLLLICGGAIAMAVLVGPVLLILEGVRFSLLPLLVFDSMGTPHASNPKGFRQLYSFLEKGPPGCDASDFEGRVRVAARFFANEYLRKSDFPTNHQLVSKTFNTKPVPGATRAFQRRQRRLENQISRAREREIANNQAAADGAPNQDQMQRGAAVVISMENGDEDWGSAKMNGLRDRLRETPPCRLSYAFPSIALRLLAMTDKELTLDGFRWATGMTTKRNWLDYSSGAKAFLHYDEANEGPGLPDAFATFVFIIAWYVYLPALLLAIAYSMVYPLASFVWTAWDDQGPLQQTLSIIYVTVLVALLCLQFSVRKNYRLTSPVFLFSFKSSTAMVNRIVADYRRLERKRLAKEAMTLGSPLAPEVQQLATDYLVETKLKYRAIARRVLARPRELRNMPAEGNRLYTDPNDLQRVRDEMERLEAASAEKLERMKLEQEQQALRADDGTASEQGSYSEQNEDLEVKEEEEEHKNESDGGIEAYTQALDDSTRSPAKNAQQLEEWSELLAAQFAAGLDDEEADLGAMLQRAQDAEHAARLLQPVKGTTQVSVHSLDLDAEGCEALGSESGSETQR